MRTLLDEKTVYSHIPPKADDLHKGSAGKLYLVAGSRSFRGAAVLATMGALRSGCGYVSLASTPEVCNNISHHLITPTLSVLPENAEGRISRSAAQTVLREAAGYGAMVLGCGLGLDADTEALVRGVLPHFEGPLVLDADGINALAHGIDTVSYTHLLYARYLIEYGHRYQQAAPQPQPTKEFDCAPDEAAGDPEEPQSGEAQPQ